MNSIQKPPSSSLGGFFAHTHIHSLRSDVWKFRKRLSSLRVKWCFFQRINVESSARYGKRDGRCGAHHAAPLQYPTTQFVCACLSVALTSVRELFWTWYRRLSSAVLKRAGRNVELLKRDPGHPQLSLRKIDRCRSVRVGLSCGTLAV